MLYKPSCEPMVDSVGTHLLRAAEFLRERGWCRYEAVDGDGHVCLEGALQYAFPNPIHVHARARARLMHYLGMKVSDWNDYCCQSPQEAWEALIAAAYYA